MSAPVDLRGIPLASLAKTLGAKRRARRWRIEIPLDSRHTLVGEGATFAEAFKRALGLDQPPN